MSERDFKNLKSCLASTAMEGFEISEQTEKDCVRFITGEITVKELVEEILARK